MVARTEEQKRRRRARLARAARREAAALAREDRQETRKAFEEFEKVQRQWVLDLRRVIALSAQEKADLVFDLERARAYPAPWAVGHREISARWAEPGDVAAVRRPRRVRALPDVRDPGALPLTPAQRQKLRRQRITAELAAEEAENTEAHNLLQRLKTSFDYSYRLTNTQPTSILAAVLRRLTPRPPVTLAERRAESWARAFKRRPHVQPRWEICPKSLRPLRRLNRADPNTPAKAYTQEAGA